jgi:hypothetical protein
MNTISIRLILLPLLVYFSFNINAQEENPKVPHLVKTPLENTGCSAYFPDDEKLVLELSYSPDSSKVYTGEVFSDNHHFSIILVELKDYVFENKEEKEGMITSYLDYLKESFSIVSAAGYGNGHTMESNPEAVGVIDYWEYIAVMIMYGPTEHHFFNIQQLFLDGFRFN